MEHIVSHGRKPPTCPFPTRYAWARCSLSGQLGNIPGTRDIVPGGIQAETRQMMENIARILNAQELSFDNLIRCTVMLSDMSQWAAFNEIYVTYFKPGRLPARSAFGTAGLALGASVEIECTAWIGPKQP